MAVAFGWGEPLRPVVAVNRPATVNDGLPPGFGVFFEIGYILYLLGSEFDGAHGRQEDGQ
jgi:hypothetical protein